MATEPDLARYKRWAWPHPMIVCWVLNPVMALNEVFLGQRMPRLTLIDQTTDKPFMERSVVPCPTCGAMHDGRLWSRSNAFGHWFGSVCPDCSGVIPCIWSLSSLLLLAVTSPVWALPVILWKKRWLEFERRRAIAKRQKAPVDAAGVPWTRLGVLYFGGILWAVIGCLPQAVLWAHGREVDWSRVVISLVVCLAVGFFWGRLMKHFMSRRPRLPTSAAE